MPYNSIVIHEICHSYMSHEAANQFLELYGYNVSSRYLVEPILGPGSLNRLKLRKERSVRTDVPARWWLGPGRHDG